MKIATNLNFQAEHYLPGHKQCGEKHSHNWKLEAAVEGEVHPETGMVMDVLDLRDYVREKVISQLEGKCINDSLKHIKQPTAENIAIWAYNQLQNDLKVSYVRVWESKDFFVEYP